MWIIHRCVVSGELQNSMQNKDNCFRSNGKGESEIVYAHLYPNLWVSVNQNEISPGSIYLRNDLSELKEKISLHVVSIHLGARLWITIPNQPKNRTVMISNHCETIQI